jgi:hypothetical protein
MSYGRVVARQLAGGPSTRAAPGGSWGHGHCPPYQGCRPSYKGTKRQLRNHAAAPGWCLYL